jgi:Ca-activated chloride channel family protein
MHWITRGGPAALLALALIVFADARPNEKPWVPQGDQAKKQQLPARISDQTYRIQVDLINVFCSVWNEDTKSYLTSLPEESFLLYEDGVRQKITNFARETNLPLTIVLLVDTSQSVAPKLKFEQDAAINFFYTVLKERDRAMLVAFDSSVTMLQDFTGEANKLAKQIRTMEAAGNTALFDAIVRTCDEKLIRETGRKAIVILSDGNDSASMESYDRARQMAMDANAAIFSISISHGGLFGVGNDNRAGDKVLKDLAADTGGKALFPFLVEDLDSAFREISDELRSQYNLGYSSTNSLHDGSYRKIEVRTTARNVKLNYRKGYFAPKR